MGSAIGDLDESLDGHFRHERIHKGRLSTGVQRSLEAMQTLNQEDRVVAVNLMRLVDVACGDWTVIGRYTDALRCEPKAFGHVEKGLRARYCGEIRLGG